MSPDLILTLATGLLAGPGALAAFLRETLILFAPPLATFGVMMSWLLRMEDDRP